jgi:hypothetical protein
LTLPDIPGPAVRADDDVEHHPSIGVVDSAARSGGNISSNDEYRVTVMSSEYRTPTGQRRFRHVIETVDSYRRTSGEAFRPLPPIRQSELG